MLRVRFAPSPTGYLHIGGARTFIFNWLYARRHNGTMILRIDDTDIARNTEKSLRSIFDGLTWLGLDWDELYRQSERVALHEKLAHDIFERGFAYRDFTPLDGSPNVEETEKSHTGTWLFNPGQREISREESDHRAANGEPFVLRFRVPRGTGEAVTFKDLVYGDQSKMADDIEDFALLRSSGVPTYHLASCADDVDLRITHIIRGQEHLANTFKHLLIFRAAGLQQPEFAHLPLLMAPDGSKLSKRRHGPVVSITTWRDGGFLPEAYINFLCLLGWSPKDDRERMSREELIQSFSFEGVNRSNAVVNFTEEDPASVVGGETSAQPATRAGVVGAETSAQPATRAGVVRAETSAQAATRAGVVGAETSAQPATRAGVVRAETSAQPATRAGVVGAEASAQAATRAGVVRAEMFDPKAVWLNAEYIRTMPAADLTARLLPVVEEAGFHITPEKMAQITPLIQERIRLLRDVLTVADFFFLDELPPYDSAELIPKKGDPALASRVLAKALEALASADFTHDGLESSLRAAAEQLGIKAGQMFEPIRVAVCGRKTAPPLFGTLEVLGRETCLTRIERALAKLEAAKI